MIERARRTSLDDREASRSELQQSLDAAHSAQRRNRLGQHATPNGLAVEIVRYLRSVSNRSLRAIDMADPALGTGSFYSAALRVFGPDRMRSAVGIELDPEICKVASDLWADSGLEIICADLTTLVDRADRPPSPNLILANPPYVRHHYLTRAQKERLRCASYRLTGVDVSGLAGLYVHFLLLATAWMKEGGYAAWLIPSEFMDVNYGRALREFLTDNVTLIRAHRFEPEDVQFDDALVSSVVLVLRKAAPPKDHAIDFTFGGTIRDPRARSLITRTVLRKSRKWASRPSANSNFPVSGRDLNAPTLADLFRIQRGIATGSNKFFVKPRTEAARLGIPMKWLRPILPSPRLLKATVIDADDDGFPMLDQQLCVIDCDLSEAVLEERHPEFWAYLRTADERGVKAGYLVGKRKPWYKQEQRAPAPFLCTYMGRGTGDKKPFRFIWNRSQAISTNLYLMLYPRRSLAMMLDRHPERQGIVFDLLGCVSGYELRDEGRVYGGGLHKIEPSELGRISAAPLVERWPELLEHVPIPHKDGHLWVAS